MARNASVDMDDLTGINDDQLIALWHKSAATMAAWKIKENMLREEIVNRMFSEKAAGTYNRDLGKGYVLKCVKKDTYTPVTKKSFPDDLTITEALEKIRALGNEGSFIADRIVKWKPELSLTEYKNASDEIKAIVTDAIVIKPAMPSLAIVEPKTK